MGKGMQAIRRENFIWTKTTGSGYAYDRKSTVRIRAPRKLSLGSGLCSQKSIRAPVSETIGLRAPGSGLRATGSKTKISGLQGTPPPF